MDHFPYQKQQRPKDQAHESTWASTLDNISNPLRIRHRSLQPYQENTQSPDPFANSRKSIFNLSIKRQPSDTLSLKRSQTKEPASALFRRTSKLGKAHDGPQTVKLPEEALSDA
jgi:hypothetical protein